MPEDKRPERPPGSFKIGNIVSVGLRLYRSHFKSYFGVSFRALVWMVLGFLGYSFAIGFAFTIDAGILGYLLGVLISLVLLAYCGARSLMNTALISRLAFGELSQQPESAKSARQDLGRRLWGFLAVQILTTLIFFVAFLLLYIALVISLFALALVPTPILSGIFALIFFLAFLVGNLWVYSRFFIPEVPIAVEKNGGAIGSIGRSWELSQNAFIRIAGVISITFLMMIPFYALVTVPLVSGYMTLIPLVINSDPTTLDPADFEQFSASIMVFYGLFFLVNLFIMPLWQSIKAVLYYDLRSRREGIDLRLRNLNS